MHQYKNRAFLKFFLIYFLSVATLILASGSFYFSQMKTQFLRAEQFSMIEYARAVKMGYSMSKFSDAYSYKIANKKDKKIAIKNLIVKNNKFQKYIPINKYGGYMQILKSTKPFEKELFDLRLKVASIQLLLLLLFALISYRLAKNALKPLKESISVLDKFAKDLIHDLNTPATSIKLNMKLLEKDKNFKENRALQRIGRSVHTISELHENLTILLQEGTFQMQEVDLFDIVRDVVQTQKQIFPKIDFRVASSSFVLKTNQNAMKQILQNIISNACKYNSKDGFVKIYVENNALYVEDSGKGIEDPEKIFERSFSSGNSSGIGLDIVKRLANSMNIDIKVLSSKNGSTFILTIS